MPSAQVAAAAVEEIWQLHQRSQASADPETIVRKWCSLLLDENVHRSQFSLTAGPPGSWSHDAQPNSTEMMRVHPGCLVSLQA